MTTLQDITLAHSRRISQIHQDRDRRLAEATLVRDAQLRGIPAAARAQREFDDSVSAARARQHTADAKAEDARNAAILGALETRARTIEEVSAARRDADLDALAARRKAEEDAEREFLLALAGAPSQPSEQAQRARAEKFERARRQFEAAQAAAEDEFRLARDVAEREESNAGRAADQKRAAANAANATAARREIAAAEQAFHDALDALTDAAPVIAAWRSRTGAIRDAARRAEDEEFERFQESLREVRS